MSARHIKGFVVADGVPCLFVDAQVDQSSQQSADCFRATLAMRGLPPGRDVTYWADTDEIKVVVQVIAGGSTSALFWGAVDKVTCDFDRGLIKVSGRDETKKPIERKTTETFKNKTSSQIVSEVSGRSGLATDVDATSDLAGKIYNNDTVKVTDQQSEWSLMQKLADREGMVCYTENGKVNFKELDDSSVGSIDIFYVPPTPAGHAHGNFISLSCDRNLQLAKTTKVKVGSWNTKAKKAIKAEAVLPGGGSDALDYSYREENLTQPQADKMAKKRLRENTRHERTVTIDAPGDPSAKPRMMANLHGTGTAFDQSYFIDKITHTIGGESYRMRLTSKNTSKKRGG